MICIEDGCGNETLKRRNYHTMSDNDVRTVSRRHHRCQRCYAGDLVMYNPGKTRSRSRCRCEGCGDQIEEGQLIWEGRRSRGFQAESLVRVPVCDRCKVRLEVLRAWQQR